MVSAAEVQDTQNRALGLLNQYLSAFGMEEIKTTDKNSIGNALNKVSGCFRTIESVTGKKYEDLRAGFSFCYITFILENYTFGPDNFYDEIRLAYDELQETARSVSRRIERDACSVMNAYLEAIGKPLIDSATARETARRAYGVHLSQTLHPDKWVGIADSDDISYLSAALRNSATAYDILRKRDDEFAEVLRAYPDIQQAQTESRRVVPQIRTRIKDLATRRQRKEDERLAELEGKLYAAVSKDANQALRDPRIFDDPRVQASLDDGLDDAFMESLLSRLSRYERSRTYKELGDRLGQTIKRAVSDAYTPYKDLIHETAARMAEARKPLPFLEFLTHFEKSGDISHLEGALGLVTPSLRDYADAFERTGDGSYLQRALEELKE